MGDFKDDLKEGYGKEDCEDYVYEGEYKNNEKSGIGKVTYKKTNDAYEGEFMNNVINGNGFYIWNNKHTYRGTFISGKMHGKGVYRWPDGGEYEGDYVNNIKEGHGVFKWPNNRHFEGPFVNGNPHGVGMLTVSDKVQEAEFINGKINKNYKKEKANRNNENLQKKANDSQGNQVFTINEVSTK